MEHPVELEAVGFRRSCILERDRLEVMVSLAELQVSAADTALAICYRRKAAVPDYRAAESPDWYAGKIPEWEASKERSLEQLADLKKQLSAARTKLRRVGKPADDVTYVPNTYAPTKRSHKVHLPGDSKVDSDE